ncbi:FecR family protein [Sphingomonas sp. PP-CE-3G-477]|uniref:FecR family protein n=1 Tax=Sphingomonas sp. PP-CE-3G-477 TaxID=2135660 RepID=UPI000D3760F6|nr:FecR domain-containing protein [Sphingomonas sp. PP-CE-3G-477]PTQ60788.1 FecR family protein [Sphingomonas sp. PP-CE-3G-477]
MTVAGGGTTVTEAALADALQTAAVRCGRLSDEQVRSLRRRRRSAIAAVATAPVAIALLFVGGGRFVGNPAVPTVSTRILATRAGERTTVTLADGSTVALNGATRLRIVYADGQRRAELLAGQAFFDVRHDVARPFVVRAGASETRVLGTAFDLDLTRTQVALAVYRGAVGFDPVGAPRGVVVRAGYRSAVRSGVAAAPTKFDPALPDWRKGWIDTTGMRLDDLVEVLDRQGGVRIARPREPLASTTVFGRFRTDRPHQLLKAIGSGFGFTVVERQGALALETAD